METKINSQNLKFKNQINNFKNPVEIKKSFKKKRRTSKSFFRIWGYIYQANAWKHEKNS